MHLWWGTFPFFCKNKSVPHSPHGEGKMHMNISHIYIYIYIYHGTIAISILILHFGERTQDVFWKMLLVLGTQNLYKVVVEEEDMIWVAFSCFESLLQKLPYLKSEIFHVQLSFFIYGKVSHIKNPSMFGYTMDWFKVRWIIKSRENKIKGLWWSFIFSGLIRILLAFCVKRGCTLWFSEEGRLFFEFF